MVVIIEGVIQDVICVCVGVTGIPIVVLPPLCTQHLVIAIDFYWLVVVAWWWWR